MRTNTPAPAAALRSFAGTLPVNPFLRRLSSIGCSFWLDDLSDAETTSVQLHLHFRPQKEVAGGQIRRMMTAGDDSHVVLDQKLLGVGRTMTRGVCQGGAALAFSSAVVGGSVSPIFMQSPPTFSRSPRPRFHAIPAHILTQSQQNITVEAGLHILGTWDIWSQKTLIMLLTFPLLLSGLFASS